MEDPQAFARPDVEASNVPADILHHLGYSARPVRSTNDDGIARYDRCGMEPDLSSNEIDFLIVIELQIDDAVPAKARHHVSSPGIQGDEAIAGRDVQDSLFPAIAPVRQPAAGQLPRRCTPPRAPPPGVLPQQLPRRRIPPHPPPP